MKKNTLLLFMIGLLILTGFGSFVAGKEVQNKALAEEKAEYIGLPEYTSIYMLKEMLPYSVYKECVRPHVQSLYSSKNITREAFAAFEQKVEKSLTAKGYSIHSLVLAQANEESFGDSVQRNLDKFNEDASKMGKEVKEGVKGLFNSLNEKTETESPKSAEL